MVAFAVVLIVQHVLPRRFSGAAVLEALVIVAGVLLIRWGRRLG